MTNKLLTAIMGLLLLATVSYGQSSFHFGLKADMDLTNISGKGMKGNFSLGFNGGAFAEYNFTPKWGLQPEVLFTQFNNKQGDDFLTYYVNSGKNDAKSSVKLSYVTVPVLLTYNVNEILSLNAGPQMSFLVYDNEDLLLRDRAAFKKLDYGVAAGLTLHVAQIRFYGRYVYGIANVNDVDDRYKWHNQEIQLGMGVTIK
ncbi:PorT family protein [Chitinophaga agrisoli]|uniref:PorT family protein n=1 Tax=Chitinophaga agrisoli TaxID=2607653 RepID=A0A5B2VYU4_9BACT|nr:porin family protein [Chitinophaga agrisoli]KAA2243159.1 PorT family protein [Chitinophaga agrisoli]